MAQVQKNLPTRTMSNALRILVCFHAFWLFFNQANDPIVWASVKSALANKGHICQDNKAALVFSFVKRG